MGTSNHRLPGRGQRVWAVANLLRWAAGVHEPTMNQPVCATERFRYGLTGAFVIMTTMWGFVSMRYALSFVVEASAAQAVLSAGWAMFIFILEASIVSSIHKRAVESQLRALGFVAIRTAMAIVISLSVSEVTKLRLFHTEIELELEFRRYGLLRTQTDSLRANFPRLAELERRNQLLRSETEARRRESEALEQEAIRELDGTGGSTIEGAGPIYSRKKARADAARDAFRAFQRHAADEIERNEEELQGLRTALGVELTRLDRQLSKPSFLARFTALERVERRWGHTASLVSRFLTLLFLVVELAPVLTKALQSRGPYDAALERHEAVAISREDAKRAELVQHEADKAAAHRARLESMDEHRTRVWEELLARAGQALTAEYDSQGMQHPLVRQIARELEMVTKDNPDVDVHMIRNQGREAA